MLVKALRLRRLGIRLSADELREEVPMLGNLRYEANPYKGQDGRGALTCLLMPLDGSSDAQVQLFSARVRRIDRRGIIIQGIEEEWRRKARTDHRQALWAWAVPPEPMSLRVLSLAERLENEALRESLAGTPNLGGQRGS